MTQPEIITNRQAGRALPLLLGATLILILGAGYLHHRYLDQRIDELQTVFDSLIEEVHSTGDAVHLMRMERGSEGLGIQAVIEQIRFWAPQLQYSSTLAAEVPRLNKILEDCNRAIAAIGAEAFPAIEAAIAENVDEDEARKALMKASYFADARLSEQLMERMLRGTQYSPSPRLRFIAADELLRVNRALAGQVLADILRSEAAMGVDRRLDPQDPNAQYLNPMGVKPFPQFFNFIARFASSGYEDKESVLLMILGRPNHDINTYREVIRELAKLKSQDAVKYIKQLYERPPGIEIRPLFKVDCLQALADIQGREAEPFFQKALLNATHQSVITKLKALIKQYQ
ncbi:MAG: hypothetical protein ACYTG5_20580 [Planctomycetota bacterium]|jgi:hypothetical protein